MNGFAENIRRSGRKKVQALDSSYLYGECLAEGEDGLLAVLDKGHQNIPRDEDFLAAVLLMIKKDEFKEDLFPKGPVVRRYEWISQACEEHKVKHVVCPANCPRRLHQRIAKYNDEDNTNLEGDGSSAEEESGINLSPESCYSSDEVFEDSSFALNATDAVEKLMAHKVSLSLSGQANRSKKTKKTPGKQDPEVSSLPMATARSGKRKNAFRNGGEAPEAEQGQAKRKYSRQRKMVRGMEMFWNPPTESYGIQKPKSTEQYALVIRWSLAQLPKKCGTTEEILSVIKEFGWPELKKGNSREALITKNTITKILLEQFLERGHNEKGEAIYSQDGSQVPADEEDLLEEEEGRDYLDEEDPKNPSLVYSRPEFEEEDSILSRDRSATTIALRTREGKAQSAEKANNSKDKPKRMTRRKLVASSDELASTTTQQSELLQEGLAASSIVRKKTNSINPSKKSSRENSRGRRWVRFACEKHRREHARCPDNCLMRKKSYVTESEENQEDDMDLESPILRDDEAKSLDEVIVDEGSTDML